MLQQTQVSTVENYFPRFMRAFPSLQALAAATVDDVLHYWSGLGYYSRARNLHKAAQQVVAGYGGALPAEPEALIALPGIGRSTAGAILALSRNQRHAILDGNVRRVLARVFGVEGWGGAPDNIRRLWELAEQCTPATRPANYTQAIMDLGATLCTRSKPACTTCPLQSICHAHAAGLTAAIPAPKPRRQRPRRSAVLIMAVNPAGDILLERRPPAGIWGGLWSFPELESMEAVEAWCCEQFSAAPLDTQLWPQVSHSFSHFDFDMQPVKIVIDKVPASVMEADRWLWYKAHSPAGIGIAAPVAKLLQQLAGQTGETA
jgi:A/G-specific adenine glycosylase